MSKLQLAVALIGPLAAPALSQATAEPIGVHAHVLPIADVGEALAAPASMMSTAISASGEIIMFSLSDPTALMAGGPTSNRTGTWVYDVAKDETHELHIARDGKPWRLVGRSALSADGRFVASACAPDLGPPPKWTPETPAATPAPVTTIALVELSGGQSNRFVELHAHGCNAPLSPHDPVSLPGDGALLAISTTADFGRGVQHGWTMLWNSADDSLRSIGLADAYFGLIGPALSADGRWLIADSFAHGEANPAGLFRIDCASGASGLASVGPDDRPLIAHMGDHALDANGRHVAFVSQDKQAKDAKRADVYVRDFASGTTQCASVAPDGADANGASTDCALSGDGRCVAFVSLATNLVQPADDALPDLFVRDLATGRTVRIGVEDLAPGDRTIFLPALSADGRRLVFLVRTKETQIVVADIDWPAASPAAPR